MIKFANVHGEVLVDDVTTHHSQSATSGLQLDSGGKHNYLIATTRTSSADVEINGKTIKLGTSSFLRVRGDQSWWDRHSEMWFKDLKRSVGRLWAHVAKDRREQDSGGGGGIRG
jgi:hypothetical protein